jgi:hypothetical protein
MEETKELVEYFQKINESVKELRMQFAQFASGNKTYIVLGSPEKYQKDLNSVQALLTRIDVGLRTDGKYIIKPKEDEPTKNGRGTSSDKSRSTKGGTKSLE